MLDPKIQNWEKESIDELIIFLYSGPEDKCFNSVVQLKNLAIGSNKQKENVINSNIVPRLLQLLIEEIDNEQLLYEIGALLCTLSKGTPLHVKYMIDFNAIQILIKKITNSNTSRSIVEICLRTLRSLFQSDYAPINTIYETHLSGIPFIAYLLNMIAKSSNNTNSSDTSSCSNKSLSSSSSNTNTTTAHYHSYSNHHHHSNNSHHHHHSNQNENLNHNYSTISNDNWCVQECILNVLASSCRTSKQQNILCQYSSISTISDLLLCDSVRVSKAGLNLLARLCHNNREVSKVALATRSKSLITNYEIELVELLYCLLDKHETQLYAARCFTNLFRSDVLNIETNKRHEEYIYKSLKVLIRLCKKENNPLDRIEAAEILSYLIEQDSNLQKLAAICDHLINSLSDYLTFNLDCVTRLNDLNNMYLLKEYKKEDIENRMKESAFKCFSSLAATDEDIRKKIIGTESLMLITVNCLTDEDSKVKLAALRCLHSLSRSIRQLQTAFQDHLVWIPLKTILLSTTDDNMLSVVSSTLCNLLLEFSPSKPHFHDKGVVEILCALTKKKEQELRLNGIWALMNMSSTSTSSSSSVNNSSSNNQQTNSSTGSGSSGSENQNLSLQILNCLGTEQIFNLLKDTNLNIVLKTLGLLRNILTVDVQIDCIMCEYGQQIMDIIMLCLNDELQVENNRNEVKEEALCILANIAHGEQSKEFIMSNEVLLKKLNSFIAQSNDQPEIVKLQICTLLCINNLIWNGNNNGKESNERKSKLKQLGFMKSLRNLLHSTNHELSDKARGALNQFQSKDLSS